MALVGSGYACDTDTSHTAHMAMAGMPMDDMPMNMPMNGGDQSNSHSDCSFPWALGGCQFMTSCAPNAIVVDGATATALATVAHDEPTSRDEQWRSVTRSPESPPPRA
jgi:hypothetical protein